MAWDVKIFFWFNSFAGQSRIFDLAVVFLSDYFQYFLIGAFILILFLSRYSRREKYGMFLAAFISAAVARLGITEIIRFFYHRPRPFMIYDVHHLITDNEYSFPSGHAAFFFAMAAAIYFYNKKWGIAFFIAGIFITLSRVAAGVHYPSDILGGAAIGIAVAYPVYYFVKRKIPR